MNMTTRHIPPGVLYRYAYDLYSTLGEVMDQTDHLDKECAFCGERFPEEGPCRTKDCIGPKAWELLKSVEKDAL